MGNFNDMRECGDCGRARNAESMDCTAGKWTCATCYGTKKAPASMAMDGPHHRPLRVVYGPCPACSGGDTCPRCLYAGGMGEGDDGRAQCRRCGWRVES